MIYPDYKNYQANPDQWSLSFFRACFYIMLAINVLIAIYGWMGERDAEPELTTLTYECAPAIEMTMPIDVVGL